MQPGWCQPVRQEFTENECEALPGVAYPGVRDNRSTVNTKTGYDDDMMMIVVPHTQGAQVRIIQCCLQITTYLPLRRKHSPDGASPD